MELQWDENRQEVFCCLSQDEAETQVSVKMLEHNQIPGLLPVQRQYIDDQIRLGYAIQGCQSLQAVLEELCPVSVRWVCSILRQIMGILLTGETFFLDMREYCLLPEYIYYDRGKQQTLLCYLPGQADDVCRAVRKLMETMMEYLDHRNKQETEWYYSFYQMYCTEEISFVELEEYLERWRLGTVIRDEKTSTIESGMRDQQQQTGQKTISAADSETVRYFFRSCHQENSRKQKRERVSILPEKLAIQPGACGVGRQQDQGIVLIPQQISRKHALLEMEKEKIYLTDQGSSNGTFVNGRRLSAYVKTRLSEGDIVTFADISYQLCASDGASSNVPPQKDGYKHGRIRHMLDDLRLKYSLIP